MTETTDIENEEGYAAEMRLRDGKKVPHAVRWVTSEGRPSPNLRIISMTAEEASQLLAVLKEYPRGEHAAVQAAALVGGTGGDVPTLARLHGIPGWQDYPMGRSASCVALVVPVGWYEAPGVRLGPWRRCAGAPNPDVLGGAESVHGHGGWVQAHAVDWRPGSGRDGRRASCKLAKSGMVDAAALAARLELAELEPAMAGAQ